MAARAPRRRRRGMHGSYVSRVFGEFNLLATDVVDEYPYLDGRHPVAAWAAVAGLNPEFVLRVVAATGIDRRELAPSHERDPRAPVRPRHRTVISAGAVGGSEPPGA